MNILILNGNPDGSNSYFDNYIYRYQLILHKLGHYVKTYTLRNLHVGPACSNNPINEGDLVYIINSLSDTDLILFTGPLINGRMAELTSGLQNKIIDYYRNRSHTRDGRYIQNATIDRLPLFGCILMTREDYNNQELLLSKLTQERMATDIHTLLSFFITTEYPLNDAVCITLKSSKQHTDMENDSNDMVVASIFNR